MNLEANVSKSTVFEKDFITSLTIKMLEYILNCNSAFFFLSNEVILFVKINKAILFAFSYFLN